MPKCNSSEKEFNVQQCQKLSIFGTVEQLFNFGTVEQFFIFGTVEQLFIFGTVEQIFFFGTVEQLFIFDTVEQLFIFGTVVLPQKGSVLKFNSCNLFFLNSGYQLQSSFILSFSTDLLLLKPNKENLKI